LHECLQQLEVLQTQVPFPRVWLRWSLGFISRSTAAHEANCGICPSLPFCLCANHSLPSAFSSWCVCVCACVCVCVHACVCVPQSCPGSLPSYSHFLMPLSLHLFLPQFPQPYWSALSLPSNLCIIPLPVGIHQSHPCACKNTD
jgi:hypothetical protein